MDVHIYETAREDAKKDFNLNLEADIKQFLVDLGEKQFHHLKEDQLDNIVWNLPKGTPLDVFYFNFKGPKDGYLSIIKLNTDLQWVIKSLKKNETSVFANNPFSALSTENKRKH